MVLCAIISLALSSASYAQLSTQAPIYGHVQDFSKEILVSAVATSERANNFVSQKNYFQALQEYETFLHRSEGVPDVLMTYPVLLAFAGAHLEAAFDRVMYSGSSPDLQHNQTLYEQNKLAINDHIANVIPLVKKAVDQANATGMDEPDKNRFQCIAREKIIAAFSLHGIVNSVLEDLDNGIQGYEQYGACIPDSKRAIQYLKGVRASISNSPLSADSMVKDVSLFVKETVPHGNIFGTCIDIAYDFYKKFNPLAPDVLPR